MNISQKQIDSFFEAKEIAVVGVSRNPKKFGYLVYKNFRDKGYKVIPVNPFAENIDEDKCYKSVVELPEEIKSIVILSKAEHVSGILQDAKEKGIQSIWIQKNLDTPESIEFAKDNFLNLIYDECIFMWMNPVKGIHSFHKSIRKMFGGLPK